MKLLSILCLMVISLQSFSMVDTHQVRDLRLDKRSCLKIAVASGIAGAALGRVCSLGNNGRYNVCYGICTGAGRTCGFKMSRFEHLACRSLCKSNIDDYCAFHSNVDFEFLEEEVE